MFLEGGDYRPLPEFRKAPVQQQTTHYLGGWFTFLQNLAKTKPKLFQFVFVLLFGYLPCLLTTLQIRNLVEQFVFLPHYVAAFFLSLSGFFLQLQRITDRPCQKCADRGD